MFAPPSVEEIEALSQTAQGQRAADLVVRGSRVVNVYTGTSDPAFIAVAGERIAYVGPEEPLIGPDTVVLDADGLLAVPGYIEPHAHADFVYNPSSMGQFYLAHGTTLVVGDSYKIHAYLGSSAFGRFCERFDKFWPGHFFWTVRPHPESHSSLEDRVYGQEQVRRALEIKQVLGLGEATRWPDIVAGNRGAVQNLALSMANDKQYCGHTAGAKGKKLAALAASGIRICHESINVAQALERLGNGMYIMLRHSSHRPDLPVLLEVFQDKRVDASRIMFNGDGAAAPFLKSEAHPGAMAGLAIREGLDPIAALRSVTINPATYLRMDHELGSVTPGRLADFNLVKDLAGLAEPQIVVGMGQVIAETGRLKQGLDCSWLRSEFKKWSWPENMPLNPDCFRLEAGTPEGETVWPVMELTDGVITKQVNLALSVESGQVRLKPCRELSYLFLIDPLQRTVAKGVVKNMGGGVSGLASSFNCTLESLLVLGSNSDDMFKAVERIREMGGGVALVEQRQVIWECPMPLGGFMSLQSLDDLAENLTAGEQLMRARGFKFPDFWHSLFFLPSHSLPYLRLTPGGLFDVMTGRFIHPSQRL